MGRFKIYDPEKLVIVLGDTNYAKCLLCERKLKNIMGNIKRHYEQMHSVYLNANANKRKNSRKKSLKFRDKDKSYKINNRTKKVFDLSNQNGGTNIAVSPTISSKNNTTSALKLPACESTRETSVNILKTSNEPINSFTLSVASQENRPQGESKTDVVPKTEIYQQLPTRYSNQKTAKRNEEDDDIVIPCYSFINSIQISSLDSCHQVEFLKLLVETKSQMNVPLGNFQKGDTFQMALQTWKQNFHFDYSSQTIGEHLDRMAKKLRQEVIKMAANRIIYLKLDIAGRKDSNVMLVNIQFIIDFDIKVVTLSALDLQNHDLATNLKEKVLTTLERYQIDISRVISITKDYTQNVRKSLKHNTTQNCLKQEEQDVTSEYSQNIDFCQHLCEHFPGHAVHFVACDIIKQLNENISQSRDSCKSLSRQLSELNIKQIPILDNTISWFSVYDMIKSLLNVREVVENNNLLLVEVDWLFATKFVASFRPIVDTALLLQTNNLFVMGDFYREWLLCEVELEELTACNELALYLLEALRRRKTHFFKNTFFLAALYLDPRFCYMGSMHLSDTQKKMAIAQLLQIFDRLKEMHEFKTNTTSLIPSNETNIQPYDRYSKLEQNMADNLKGSMATMASHRTESLNNMDYQSVKESLEQLQFEQRLPFNANILDYWKILKYKSPVLTQIAEIALAAPATQATINRALDAVSISLMKEKLNENTDIIENLLMLKLNQGLVEKITLEM